MKSPVRSNSRQAGRTQNFGPAAFLRATSALRGFGCDFGTVPFTGTKLGDSIGVGRRLMRVSSLRIGRE